MTHRPASPAQLPRTVPTGVMAFGALALAVIGAAPALACGPNGSEVGMLTAFLTLFIALFALTQWVSVRMLHTAFAHGWSVPARLLTIGLATATIGQGLFLALTAMSEVPPLGIPFMAVEMLAVVKAVQAVATGLSARRIGSL